MMFSRSCRAAGFIFMAIIIFGAICQYIAERMDERSYPPIGKMIDIGGYRLHMIDQGSGNLPVVIDTGFMGNSFEWLSISSEIAKFARVIIYDRAGYAWSDRSPLPRISENVIEELHTMLKNADVAGPYVLVVHSFGGMNMRLFATKYPDEVAGVVLVDAGHEDGFEKMPMEYVFNKRLLPFMIAITYLGVMRIIIHLSMMEYWLDAETKNYPPSIQQLYNSQKTTIKYVQTVAAEMLGLNESCHNLKQNCRLLGNKPLTVIAAAKPFTLAEILYLLSQKQLNQVNLLRIELQTDLVSKSLRGKQIIAKNSGHNIHRDQPELIIEAVREMIEELMCCAVTKSEINIQ